MSSPFWDVPVELVPAEALIAKRLTRTGKLFVFLRRFRHRLFDSAFQAELASMYSDRPRGTPPLPPAMLAMATLLQAYEQASDAVAVENAVFDRRWQMVLNNLGTDVPPFSQGVLVDFRSRLLEHDMDRRLLERTVELAKETGAFGHKALRVALDSAPLWGAGRVEDTFNLIGHAMSVVVRCTAMVTGLEEVEVRAQAGTRLLGSSSIKAALDIDWDDPAQQADALQRLLDDANALRDWISRHVVDGPESPPLRESLEMLARVIEQDLEPDPTGPGHRIRQGTAKDRRISITDGAMRHGRKSKSTTIKGFKRHIATDLDTGIVLAVAVRPANEPEYRAEDELRPGVERLAAVHELHIDRGYLAGEWPRALHAAKRGVFCKPWKDRGARIPKSAFRFDFQTYTVTCPEGKETPIRAGTASNADRAQFSVRVCRPCPRRSECYSQSKSALQRGRTLTVHASEPLLQDLRDARSTPEGRRELRRRTGVEHRLAHVTRRQGRRARYIGLRKNTLDLRRVAAVENLHCIARLEAA